MNSLSWLIYAANVTGSLGGFLVFLTVLMGAFTLAAGIVAVVHMDETRNYRTLEGQALEDCRKTKRKAFKAMAGLFAGMMFMGTLASLMPNRQTVLLIAASEIGERIITHQRVQDVIDPSVTLLQTWIEQQTRQIQQQLQGNNRQ